MLATCVQFFFVCLFRCCHLRLLALLYIGRQTVPTCSIFSPWMLILRDVSFLFSMTIVLVFSALIIRPNLLLVSSIGVVISCSYGSLLVRKPMSSANRDYSPEPNNI